VRFTDILATAPECALTQKVLDLLLALPTYALARVARLHAPDVRRQGRAVWDTSLVHIV